MQHLPIAIPICTLSIVPFDSTVDRTGYLFLAPGSWLDISNLGFDEGVWHATRKKCEEGDAKR